MSQKLTSDTMVPLSIFGVLAGGIFWLSIMYENISHATSEIDVVKKQIIDVNTSRASYRSKLWDNQRQIDRRLSKIEGKIDFIVDELKRN